MKNRLLPPILLFVMLLSLAGSAWAAQPDSLALLQVFVPDAKAMGRFAVSGLPVYKSMDGFLLTGALASGQARLDAIGLKFRLLDTNLRGGHYYLAYIHSNQLPPAWEEYGHLLLAGDDYALLRSTPEAADRLAAVVLGLQAISLTPKPLPDLAAAADVFPEVITPNPFVQQMIDQVTLEDVYALTAGLSGVNPVTIGGAPYTILTRHTDSGEPIQQATQYVGEYLLDLGLTVEYHAWDSEKPPNVIGELLGLVNPQDIYIIGGHLDDMPNEPIAPGADDNASGSVATMLAAQIFSQYYWGCTLRFALWTGEEQGLLGSAEYAERSYLQGENIKGYINLDMIAWDSNGHPGIDLHAKADIPATVNLAQLFSDVITAYSLDLVPEIISTGMGASDHDSFWDFGYVSILAIEDMGDFNDYYHTPADQLQYLNMEYYTEFIQATLATFAHMSNCLLPTGSLEGTVREAGSTAPIPGAALVFTNALGNTFSLLTDASGDYTTVLPTGDYTATVSAAGYQPATISGVTILADTLRTQDFELSLLPDTWVIFLPMSMRGSK